jgi:hypothetical protein
MAFTRRTNILFIIIASILLTMVLFFGWKVYRDSQPQSYINFEQFTPTEIVDGLHITEKNVEVWESHPLLWFRPYEVNIRSTIDDKGSSIVQTKAKSDSTIDISDFYCQMVGVTCFNRVTPHGTPYLLSHTRTPSDLKARPLTYDKLSTQSIWFVKGGTSISVGIEGDRSTAIPDNDWSAMIDSFVPTTFTDLHVKHMRPGP